MTREEMEMVVASDNYADKDRAWIAAHFVAGDKPIRTSGVAEYLGWPVRRTQTALVAAEEAGLITKRDAA